MTCEAGGAQRCVRMLLADERTDGWSQRALTTTASGAEQSAAHSSRPKINLYAESKAELLCRIVGRSKLPD